MRMGWTRSSALLIDRHVISKHGGFSIVQHLRQVVHVEPVGRRLSAVFGFEIRIGQLLMFSNATAVGNRSGNSSSAAGIRTALG